MRHGKGCLAPFCCNVPMEITETVNTIFRCKLCGSEVMSIKEGEGTLKPFCCDNLMVVING
jgi:desulfoferrodoxin-like iron-binding protein